MRKIVNALLIRDDSVLLVRRSPRRSAYPGLWSFPGGHVEHNEIFVDALARELSEEIGVTPVDYAPLCVIADPSARDPTDYHMYAVTQWCGEPVLLGDEHVEMVWLTFERAIAVPDLALDEYRALLKDCSNAKHRHR